MKTPFSSVITPPPHSPKQCCKCFVDVYLFPTLNRGGGEATFHERREGNTQGIKDGKFQVSQRLMSMIVVLISLTVLHRPDAFNLNTMELGSHLKPEHWSLGNGGTPSTKVPFSARVQGQNFAHIIVKILFHYCVQRDSCLGTVIGDYNRPLTKC